MRNHVFVAVLIMLFTLSNNSKAEHLIGGELTYEYIGDSTQIDHQFLVRLKVYTTTKFTTFGPDSAIRVCIYSSCFPNDLNQYVYRVSPQGGVPYENSDECVDSTYPGHAKIFVHYYENVITLAGYCLDFYFMTNIPCCTPSIANIANLSGGSPLIQLSAFILYNNNFAINSSPKFLETKVPVNVCHFQDVSLNYNAIDPDGDSLSYHFENVKFGNCSPNPTSHPFAPGYSLSHPFDTDTGSVELNDDGIINFKTSALPGMYFYSVRVKNYRLHPSGNFTAYIGSSVKTLLLNVSGNCSERASKGPYFDASVHAADTFPEDFLNITNAPSLVPNADTIYNPTDSSTAGILLPTIEYECLSTKVDVFFDQNIFCNSISSDGSEFQLLGPDSNYLPIIGIEKHCDSFEYTKHITLELLNPLPMNGDFIITILEGSDSNTFQNKCGFFTLDHSTIVLQSIDCDIISTEVFENKRFDFKVIPNPNNGIFEVIPNMEGKDYKIRVYSLQGVCLIEKETSASIEIDASRFSAGNYILSIENVESGATVSKRILIQ
ncbi:MAG: T9SS type A sorting domain-containing protein [Cryomorphaceae bacterium]|nr:T9SS type A sorting domain-containing protein [Cryomorphaceae bacterium]